MSKYILFVDDVRRPRECMHYMLGRIFDINMYRKDDWIIARSYKEFIDHIRDRGMPDFVSFDHDLADEHYMKTHVSDFPEYYSDGTYKEKTGYDCAAFLIEYCMDNNEKFPPYAIHSQNPVGTANIQSLIDNYKKYVNTPVSRAKLY